MFVSTGIHQHRLIRFALKTIRKFTSSNELTDKIAFGCPVIANTIGPTLGREGCQMPDKCPGRLGIDRAIQPAFVPSGQTQSFVFDV